MGRPRGGQYADEQRIHALFAGVYERAGAKGRLYYIIVVVYTQVTRKLRRFGHKKDLVNRSFRGRNNEKQGFLAGVAGFEPTNDGVRVRCLTAWRHPKIY